MNKQHGIYIPPFKIPTLKKIPNCQVEIWEKKYEQIWNLNASTEFRSAFFKKPVACLKSPFKKTYWIDIDCKIEGDLSPLFNLLSFGIELVVQPISTKDNKILFSSGVIGFTQNANILSHWNKLASKYSHLFPGDQEPLSLAISTYTPLLMHLPEIYNWSYLYPKRKDTVITHYHGNGKSQIPGMNQA